jgi:N-acetylmuramidase
MVAGEDEQLGAMATFIVGKGLALALQRADWTTFARGYNGADSRRTTTTTSYRRSTPPSWLMDCRTSTCARSSCD